MGRTMTSLVQLAVGIMDLESWKSVEMDRCIFAFCGPCLSFCKLDLALDALPVAL